MPGVTEYKPAQKKVQFYIQNVNKHNTKLMPNSTDASNPTSSIHK